MLTTTDPTGDYSLLISDKMPATYKVTFEHFEQMRLALQAMIQSVHSVPAIQAWLL